MKKFIPLSDRVTMIQIKSKPCDINFIQGYAPTVEKSDTELRKFMAKLNNS